jgi:hypothetical protein
LLVCFRMMPSANGERQILPKHTKSTLVVMP